MKHVKSGRKLNRSVSHRKAMIANMAASLIEHERVVTTPQKAKEVKRVAERLVTLAKKGGIKERQKAFSILKHRWISGVNSKENHVPMKAVQKLFSDIGKRFLDRNGGYTRILRLGGSRRGEFPLELKYKLSNFDRTLRLAGRRLGDNAEQAILEWVGIEDVIDVENDNHDEE